MSRPPARRDNPPVGSTTPRERVDPHSVASTDPPHEQANVGLSNETPTPAAVTVRWATSRTVTNVPSVPLTRTWVAVVGELFVREGTVKISSEPTPPIRSLLVPFAILLGGSYLLFTASAIRLLGHR